VGPSGNPPKKWGSYPVLRTGDDRRNFINLKFQGTLPVRTRMSDSTIDRKRDLSRFSRHGSSFLSELIGLAGDNFYVVVPTRDMVEKVMRKWEDRPPHDLSKVRWLDHALLFLKAQYGHLFKDAIASDEEVFYWIDMSKSGGYPATYFLLRTKRDVFSDSGFVEFFENFDYVRPGIWSISPKKEILPLATIDEGKCRLFCIPDTILVFNQLKFGKKASIRMKNYKWSAYGFNPYGGGCDRLAQKLLSKPIRFYYDVSGWDKFLPILDSIYLIIRGEMDFEDDELRKRFDWTMINTVVMHCKMYDGTVYIKDYGNGSGSGTTTRDNILAHIVIISVILVTAFYEKYGKLPTSAYLDSQIINLFGDDSICAVDEEFDYVLKPNFVADIFALFGMTLKYFHGGWDYPLKDMEFLGFSFFHTCDGYLPLYNEVRLATGLIYDGVNSNTREAFVSKAFAISYMSYPCSHHKFFLGFAREVARFVLGCHDLNETERVMCSMLISWTDSDVLSSLMGLESSDPRFLECFYRGLEVEGTKELFPQWQQLQ